MSEESRCLQEHDAGARHAAAADGRRPDAGSAPGANDNAPGIPRHVTRATIDATAAAAISDSAQ